LQDATNAAKNSGDDASVPVDADDTAADDDQDQADDAQEAAEPQ